MVGGMTRQDVSTSANTPSFSVGAASASSSLVAGGSSLIIVGAGLTDPMTVHFGDVPSPHVGPVTSSPAVYFGATDGRGTPHFRGIAKRGVSVMNQFSRWAGDSSSDFKPFPLSWVESVHKQGVIPMVTWNPTYVNSNSCKRYRSLCTLDLAGIAAGDYDAYIFSAANQIKKSGIPIFLRTMHEANGDWYPWNVQASESRSAYIAAWRHIHDVFEKVGATNVAWVWCPNVRATRGATAKVPLDSFYPGDAYVDWVGLDGYNRGTDRSFAELFGSSLAELKNFSTKPVMIAEMGSQEFKQAGAREDFLRDTFEEQLPKRFPEIRAVLYFMNSRDVDLSITPAQTLPTL